MEIAEFHAMQLPIAKAMRQCLACVRAADAMRVPQTIDNLIAYSDAKAAAYDAARSQLEQSP